MAAVDIEVLDGAWDLIEEYAALTASPDMANAARRRELVYIINDWFWGEFAKRLARAVPVRGKSLDLAEDEKFLFNTGFFSQETVEDYSDAALHTLRRDFRGRSTPRFTSLVDYLRSSFRSFTNREESRIEGAGLEIELAVDVRQQLENYRAVRSEISGKLRDKLKVLPGIAPRALASFNDGSLDATIDRLVLEVRFQPADKAAEAEKSIVRLLALRRRIAAKARERLGEEKTFTLLRGLYDKIGDLLVHGRGAEDGETAPGEDIELAERHDKRLAFIADILKRLRILLNIGSIGSGVTRTHSVFRSFDKRPTRSQIGRYVALVKTCDLTMPEEPIVVQAPYVGTGFYAWNHNILFLPMRTMHSNEETIVGTFARYRLQELTMRRDKRIIEQYKEVSDTLDYRKDFMSDYMAWVLQVGSGQRGAQSPAVFEWFRNNIGPDPEKACARRELLRMPAESAVERIGILTERMNDKNASYEELWDLATLLWLRRRDEETQRVLYRLMDLNPLDGKVYYVKGMIAKQDAKPDLANRYFRVSIRAAPNSIWAVYALDALT